MVEICKETEDYFGRYGLHKGFEQGGIIMNKVVRNTAIALFSALAAGAWLFTPAYKAQAEDAASTYNAKCVMCHLKDGSGNKGMHVPDLRSKAVQAKSDAALSDVIEKGKGIMPGYSSQLSKEEINGLVAYIRQLGKKK
jgi:mono/diheme cytochrome c family protein